MSVRMMMQGRKPAGGGAWSPLDLPDLAAWYDASHAASFTYSAGTTVSQWNDRSGNGQHLAVGAAGPERNGAQNGLDTVVFAAGDKLYRVPSTALGATGLTLVQAWKQAGTLPTYMRPPFGLDDGVNKSRPIDRWHSATENKLFIDQGGGSSVNMTVNLRGQSTFCVHSILLDKDSAAAGVHGVRERLDGVDATNTTDTATWSTANQNAVMGERSDGATDFVGHVGEVVVVNRVLTTTELSDLESYLATRWGVTL